MTMTETTSETETRSFIMKPYIYKLPDEVEVNESCTHGFVNGEEVEVKDFRSGDHQGHEWLKVEFVDGGEYISYDDGISWQEME